MDSQIRMKNHVWSSNDWFQAGDLQCNLPSYTIQSSLSYKVIIKQRACQRSIPLKHASKNLRCSRKKQLKLGKTLPKNFHLGEGRRSILATSLIQKLLGTTYQTCWDSPKNCMNTMRTDKEIIGDLATRCLKHFETSGLLLLAFEQFVRILLAPTRTRRLWNTSESAQSHLPI